MTKKDKADTGADEVQANMDEETDKGYSGTKVDTTPDEAYSVKGVTSGQPTPESDPDLAPARNLQHENLKPKGGDKK